MWLLSFRPKEHWFLLAERLAALADHNPVSAHDARVTAADETVENPYPAIRYSDWRWNVHSFAELDLYRRQLAETVAPHTKLLPFWSDVTTCLRWSGALNNPQHRLVIRNAPTILLAKSRHDVGTPKAWTLAVAQQIPNSVLLEYDGVGHGTFRISTCARQHIENYLIARLIPQPGRRCPAEYPTQPSTTTSAGATTTSIGRPAHAHRPRISAWVPGPGPGTQPRPPLTTYLDNLLEQRGAVENPVFPGMRPAKPDL